MSAENNIEGLVELKLSLQNSVDLIDSTVLGHAAMLDNPGRRKTIFLERMDQMREENVLTLLGGL